MNAAGETKGDQMVVTKEMLKAVSADVDAALAEIARKHGFAKMKMGNITFSPTGFTSKLIAETADREEGEFKRYASLLGLKADDFGRRFKVSGAEYEICGVRPRKAKPILARRLDNQKTYVFPSEYVATLLSRAA
jgi:hypothetical protein